MRKRNMAKQENTKEEGLKSFFNNSHLCRAETCLALHQEDG